MTKNSDSMELCFTKYNCIPVQDTAGQTGAQPESLTRHWIVEGVAEDIA